MNKGVKKVLVGRAYNSTLNVYKYIDSKGKECHKDGTPKSVNKVRTDKHKKEKKPYTIPVRSKKRAAEEKLYKEKTRVEYLAANTLCQIRVAGCTHDATEIHHAKGRIGELLNDKKYFRATCRNCHDWAENNPIDAKKRGASVSRLSK